MSKPFDPTKPVQTRDGRKAIILATDLRHEQPIAARVIAAGGRETLETFNADGSFFLNGGESDWNLINIPEKITVDFWVNLYPDGSIGDTYTTRNAADVSASGMSRVACLHFSKEFIRGEGL